MNETVARRLVTLLAVSALLALLPLHVSAGELSDPSFQPRTAQAGQDKEVEAGDLEIVGTVLSNKCQLSPDKDDVLTLYEVRVVELREGEIDAEAIITVAVRGGMVMFKADGTEVSESNQLDTKAEVEVEEPERGVSLEGVAATIYTPSDPSQLMENGVTYVLRLEMDEKWKTYKLLAVPERVVRGVGGD